MLIFSVPTPPESPRTNRGRIVTDVAAFAVVVVGSPLPAVVTDGDEVDVADVVDPETTLVPPPPQAASNTNGTATPIV
jgi:hypothetical protein